MDATEEDFVTASHLFRYETDGDALQSSSRTYASLSSIADVDPTMDNARGKNASVVNASWFYFEQSPDRF